MVAIGAGGLCLFVPEVWLKYRARGWPQTRANVTTARRVDPGGWAGEVTAGAEVELHFFYNTPAGRFDATQKVSPDFARGLGITRVERIVPQSVSAPAVPCWYDPAAPRRAVLERELVRKDWVPVAGLAPIGVGVLVIIGGRRVSAAVARDPVDELRWRNDAGWKVEPLPDGGARCEIDRLPHRTSLASITAMFSSHPLEALDVFDLPLRPGDTCRFRVVLLDPSAPGVSIDLQAGTPQRGILRPAKTVWTANLVGPHAALTQDGVVSVELPEELEILKAADEWWVRVVAEAGAAVHPPALLILPFDPA
jgi:hypothetical protein